MIRLSDQDWEEWAVELLCRRYGPAEYQRIPDKDRGDAGIEGFSISLGHAYQIYGPEEPLTVERRYEKLRVKITKDIKKFISNRDKLQKLLGTVKISRWILLVPHFDSKRIVEHAAKKTAEVIAANLPYVKQDFRVVVEDETAFAAELQELINCNVGKISILANDIAPKQVDEWANDNDLLVRRTDEKIERLGTLSTQDKRRKFRDKMITHYLEGQNAMSELREYPATYESVIKIKSARERYLEIEAMLSSGDNRHRLNDALDNYKKALRSETHGISHQTIEVLVYEAISDWFIRCPLDFEKKM